MQLEGGRGAGSLRVRGRLAASAVVAWSLACGPLVAFLLLQTRSGWAAMAAYHGGCVLLSSLFGGLGPRPRWTHLVASAAAVAALVLGAGMAFLAVLQESRPPMTRWAEWGLLPPGDTWILVYYVAVNPWAEEGFWRGTVVGPRVRALWGRRATLWLSTLGFALFHVFVLGLAFNALTTCVTMMFVLGAGVAWTTLRLRTGNVWWSAATHQATNVGLAILYLVELRTSA